MPVRFAASRKGRRVPGRNVCSPWRSACTSWAASSSASPSSAARLITPLLLLVGVPPVSAPSTNRARTLRKGISSLETGIASVRQAYDGRPVVPRRCLLRCHLCRVGLGLHLYSLLWVWPPYRCQAATLSSILYNILQLYHRGLQSEIGAYQELFIYEHYITALPTSRLPARQRRTPARRHRA